MLPPLFLNVFLVATVALIFLMSMPAYESSRILHGEEQNLTKKGQVPPISVSINPPTIGNTLPSILISKKAFTSYHFNFFSLKLRRQLLKGPVPPSSPNPHTHNPPLTARPKSSPPHPHAIPNESISNP